MAGRRRLPRAAAGQIDDRALRAGHGRALDPNYYLRRTLPAQPGPFFQLDIDSFWTPAASIPEYNRDAVRATFHNLYEPAHALFQEMLTSRLRDDLLG